ncbi:MAG: hypothetical protein E7564_09760 [Ruminococcaceae bacterium]|nr:hypothetical protein [Oscillospiraceae bacterium]
MKKTLINFSKYFIIFLLISIFAFPVFSDETISENTETNVEEIAQTTAPQDIEFLEEPIIDIFDPAFESFTLQEKLLLLRDIFPHKAYWNSRGYDGEIASYLNVAHQSCAHNEGKYYCNTYNGKTRDFFPWANNIQCLGFASMISDFLFGKDAKFESFYDYEKLDVGDHIRLTQATHSMIVIEKKADYIKVVECNSNYNNCFINWDREISKEDLMQNSGDYIFFKRIP